MLSPASEDVILTKDDTVELIKEIRGARIETIRWSFIFWIGQVTVLAGLLMYFLKR